MLGGGWFTKILELHSYVLLSLLCWFVWLCHFIPTRVLAILPSLETLKLKGTGWKSLLIFQLRNGITIVLQMISITGALITLPSQHTKVMFMVFSSEPSILNLFPSSLPGVMNPILGEYNYTYFFDNTLSWLLSPFPFQLLLKTLSSFVLASLCFFLAENFSWDGQFYPQTSYFFFQLFSFLLLRTVLVVNEKVI